MQEVIKQIKTPALLIWGNNDPITPPEIGEEFHTLLINSELHFLENCGHVPTQEKPNEVIALIKSFFYKVNFWFGNTIDDLNSNILCNQWGTD